MTDDRQLVTSETTDWRSATPAGQASSRELKPEQQRAAHTLDRHISVTAGPGAGKTTVLVERYLHILRTQDVSVDQIVAITFTNRAANEMRGRLRRELDRLLRVASPIDRAKWVRHKRTLDGAIINTIHGFCARLLREFPVEADIDPQFTLLEAHQSSLLEEAVVEEALTEFISANHQTITELAAAMGRPRLARGLIDIYRSTRNQGLTLGWLADQTKQTHKTIDDYKAAIEETTLKIRELVQTRGLSATVEAKRREISDRWPRLRELLTALAESTSPAELCEAIQEFREVSRPAKQGRVKDLVLALDELIWERNLRGRIPQIFLDLYAARYAQDLVEVLRCIEQHLDEEKRRVAALDFDDLQTRALRLLNERPEVLRRTSRRYRFFLVDEFQDTNGLQRELLAKLVFGEGPGRDNSVEDNGRRRERLSGANLFIVGDRKQSIYGFRGADVDVFREMTERIEASNGARVPLSLNFRSQPPLIRLFNFLFDRIFERDPSLAGEELNELGYVGHEPGVAARDDGDPSPLVELLIDLRPGNNQDDRWLEEPPRARDAEQLAARIISLAQNETISTGEQEVRRVAYGDIALLFRAMTEVHIYESAFRRAGLPYVTVEGKGFYAREEVDDFIQLLRFLDNKTDEVALAAVLRSPICGLSDDALFALRCAPLSAGSEPNRLQKQNGVRPLLEAVRQHELIDLIEPSERPALDRARGLLERWIGKAGRTGISELLRIAVEDSQYRIVAAATFDGAQRLANLEKLFTLAQRFSDTGANLIRDFVRFVRDFEEAGGRESEGEIDESADAVRLMSIHQSKGLEFPVVIIPDLHRQPDNRRDWWALDRHLGMTSKVHDGRGKLLGGSAFTRLGERAKLREEFESMRLLYVAATRAQDRLILSGAAKDIVSLRNSWLDWVCKAFKIGGDARTGLIRPEDGVELLLTLNLLDTAPRSTAGQDEMGAAQSDLLPPSDGSFPLIGSILSEPRATLHRFSITQLVNYKRCPRQYYFDRVLHTPSDEEVAVWNDAEAPEPPANLTATLRGAVIHRFCEKLAEGDDIRGRLKTSFEEVLAQRIAELGQRMSEIDPEKAIRDLVPLAKNYVGSSVRERIESARLLSDNVSVTKHPILGVFSEQRFRLRRPLGILTGTIDKLLVKPAIDGNGVDVEIIDFKTNRFRGRRPAGKSERGQLSFDFLRSPSEAVEVDRDLPIQADIEATAADYRIQMQAYTLAAWDLIPEARNVRVTLHFLSPDVEVSLPDNLSGRESCAVSIDETMEALVSSSLPGSFSTKPAEHCRVCSFVELCLDGLIFLA